MLSEGKVWEIRVVLHEGELEEEMQEVSDPLIKEFLDDVPLEMIMKDPESEKWIKKVKKRLKEPDIAVDESVTEIYIPTLTYALLKNLHQKFPKHELLLADFDYLPEAIDGINGPAVMSL